MSGFNKAENEQQLDGDLDGDEIDDLFEVEDNDTGSILNDDDDDIEEEQVWQLILYLILTNSIPMNMVILIKDVEEREPVVDMSSAVFALHQDSVYCSAIHPFQTK